MYHLQQTDVFDEWLAELRDAKGKARILARLESVRLGNLGDSKSLGGGLHERESLLEGASESRRQAHDLCGLMRCSGRHLVSRRLQFGAIAPPTARRR